MTQTTPTCLWNDSASIQELTYSLSPRCRWRHLQSRHRSRCVEKRNVRLEGPHSEPPCRAPPEPPKQKSVGKSFGKCPSRVRLSCVPSSIPMAAGMAGSLSKTATLSRPPSNRRPGRGVQSPCPQHDRQVPVTHAGISAIEEATYRGISINATVSFTLSQCIAVAEAVERGLKRREKEGNETSSMGPVCTIMVGRLDDWLKVAMERENISTRSRLP